MLDTLIPFSQSLSERIDSGASLIEAWTAAARLATDSAAATSALLPRLGRARPHAEKSLGTPDPGAVSLALIVNAVAAIMTVKDGAS